MPHAKTPSTPLSSLPSPEAPLALLGGLSPAQFMRRHWQKKPLLIRAALPGFAPLLSRQQLFDMAGDEAVESRLIVRKLQGWTLKQGPLDKKQLPPLKQAGWTLLVQGVDQHLEAAHALLRQFRFVPDARLDDLMISWASDGGGVGPHFDSYDVFLLQATGRRRWRIGRQADLSLQPDVPLKILRHFEPEEEFVLEPGDMLYLPPKWAHDGDAVGGDCSTYSIGFRAPQRGGLAGELLQRMADEFEDPALYRDPQQPATTTPAAMPAGLEAFAADALQRLLAERGSLACALGEVMTEPKPRVWFDEPDADWSPGALQLDRRTRMMYDDRHVFINGESFRAGGADARLMRALADHRGLDQRQVARASEGALALLEDWFDAGWLLRVAD
ncbi:JmjC domain-containing protein [Hydrogenophaga sp. BPS33]|uniref:JmjC domain-containing protein n=1 Tax=Hydrogenophaga sp. BPS33 TaxID=2651974 RepID=UPI0013200B98|nr:cupin domain-containing protein [Hydrogenophaga sp. BPS33]QHE85275.1 cupin domain-containing protein [Hydrogenophaga sp. BPS33]